MKLPKVSDIYLMINISLSHNKVSNIAEYVIYSGELGHQIRYVLTCKCVYFRQTLSDYEFSYFVG